MSEENIPALNSSLDTPSRSPFSKKSRFNSPKNATHEGSVFDNLPPLRSISDGATSSISQLTQNSRDFISRDIYAEDSFASSEDSTGWPQPPTLHEEIRDILAEDEDLQQVPSLRTSTPSSPKSTSNIALPILPSSFRNPPTGISLPSEGTEYVRNIFATTDEFEKVKKNCVALIGNNSPIQFVLKENNKALELSTTNVLLRSVMNEKTFI